MNVNDYCKNVELELGVWKARLFDLQRKFDALPGVAKDKVIYQYGDLVNIITELEDRLGTLRTECPTEWSPVKKEIDDGTVDLRSKYEETMESIGKAAPVSIPG
ncbi:MAG: hypothetical protein R6W95_16945 [Desulfosarcina sp.]